MHTNLGGIHSAVDKAGQDLDHFQCLMGINTIASIYRGCAVWGGAPEQKPRVSKSLKTHAHQRAEHEATDPHTIQLDGTIYI